MNTLKHIIIGLCLFSLASCGGQVSQKVGEKILEKATGVSIQAENINKKEDDKKGHIKVTFDGEEVLNSKNIIPNIQLTSDMIALALRIKGNGQTGGLIGIQGKNGLYKHIPLTAVTESGEKFTFSFMLTYAGNKTLLVKNGTLNLKTFSQEKFEFTMKGEGGYNTPEVHQGKNLKPIECSLVFENPTIGMIGVKREEVFQ